MTVRIHQRGQTITAAKMTVNGTVDTSDGEGEIRHEHNRRSVDTQSTGTNMHTYLQYFKVYIYSPIRGAHNRSAGTRGKTAPILILSQRYFSFAVISVHLDDVEAPVSLETHLIDSLRVLYSAVCFQPP